jgi:hypothetical protein
VSSFSSAGSVCAAGPFSFCSFGGLSLVIIQNHKDFLFT